jgi:hypothetical protein
MKGHYNVKLLSAGGFSDEDFHAAIKNGTIDDMLDSLDVLEEYDHDNQLLHLLSGSLFYRIFNAPAPSSGHVVSDGNMLHYVCLCTDTEEPTYSISEWWNDLIYGGGVIAPNGNSADTDVKRPSSAARTHQVVVEPNASGLRAVYDVQRWLWTPSQGNSSSIRTLKLCATNDNTDVWYYLDEVINMSQTRLKDSNGNPVTLTKTSSEVLLVQWTLTMKSI